MLNFEIENNRKDKKDKIPIEEIEPQVVGFSHWQKIIQKLSKTMFQEKKKIFFPPKKKSAIFTAFVWTSLISMIGFVVLSCWLNKNFFFFWVEKKLSCWLNKNFFLSWKKYWQVQFFSLQRKRFFSIKFSQWLPRETEFIHS